MFEPHSINQPSHPIVAVVVAAGAGTRMQTPEKKPFLDLGGIPLLLHCLLAINKHPLISDILVVTSEENIDRVKEIAAQNQVAKISGVIPGGIERQDSVRAGLMWIHEKFENPLVLVHDAARPFVSGDLMSRCIQAALRSGAATAAVPVKDTIKRVISQKQQKHALNGSQFDESSNGPFATGPFVKETLPRSDLYQTQTPQGFQFELIWRAHQQAVESRFAGTDDAGLVERMGLPVEIVLGDYTNFKITTPDDLWLAEAYLKRGSK